MTLLFYNYQPHKPTSRGRRFKLLSKTKKSAIYPAVDMTYGRRKGKGCVKEKPFAGFSFASSEADNPPVGGGSRREPGTK